MDVVLLPVLEQVVAGHVGAVARADERREPETPAVDLLEDRRAERAGLTEEAGSAAGRHQGRQRRVQGRRRIGVDHAEGVGTDQAQPVGAGQPDQSTLSLPALFAGLGEARRDHEQAVDALGCAVEHDVLDRVGGDGHDRDVHVARDVVDRGVRRHAGHRVGRRVHGVHATGEVAHDEVADERLADGVLPTARADHGDRARVQEPLDRRRLGAVLAGDHHADRRVGRVDRELQGHDAVGVPAADPVAGVAERRDHLLVVGQHLGDEPLDAALAAGLGEVLEQQLGDPTTLVTVLHEERDLRLAVLHDVVAAHGDHQTAELHHERHPVVVVDVREPPHVLVGQRSASE